MKICNLKIHHKVLKERINKAGIEVMTENSFTSGKQVKELEDKFADYVGVKHCISSGNGIGIITIMLMV